MIGATRAVKAFMDQNNHIPRMETAVRRDFAEGHRWAQMLGFVNETLEIGMKNYGIDGATYDLYARCQ
jgi:hypothetical protein